jgi:hypothetical protein
MRPAENGKEGPQSARQRLSSISSPAQHKRESGLYAGPPNVGDMALILAAHTLMIQNPKFHAKLPADSE